MSLRIGILSGGGRFGPMNISEKLQKMKIPMHIECIGDWEGAGMSLDEPGGGLEVYQPPW